MMQIVTGMYFRQVPLTETLHREVFYSNIRTHSRPAIELPFGRLLPSTSSRGLQAYTVEATERLEAVAPNGGREMVGSIGGGQLLDEIAAVVAFSLNAVFLRDLDTARRLLPERMDGARHANDPSSILRSTFDTRAGLTDGALRELHRFIETLLALRRRPYVAAMRAIRQIVDATTIVGDDPTLTYTLIVAALESLAQSTEPVESVWEEYDSKKRKRIDDAMEGLDPERRRRIEVAVLANEHGSLQRRFVSFVLEHVHGSFYREEAIGTLRPVTSCELPAVLNQAYSIRSRNVHALQELAPEVLIAAQRSETALVGDHLVLSLEGLLRLGRHVVRQFVHRSAAGVDADFDYRSELPGIAYMRVAARHWISDAGAFDRNSAPRYLDGMISMLLEELSKRSEFLLVDMTPVLARIEKTAAGLTDRRDRIAMAGIMSLWNHFAPPERRWAPSPKLAALFEKDIDAGGIVAFAVALLTGTAASWPDETLETLVLNRRIERLRAKAQPMPARIDAALHLLVADRLLSEDRRADGLSQLASAVETVPGSPELIRYEEAIGRGEDPTLDLERFLSFQEGFLG